MLIIMVNKQHTLANIRVIIIRRTWEKSISQPFPAMTCFCPVLPVSCISVCFLVSGSLSSFSYFIYMQSSGSCLSMLPLWATVCTERRTVRVQWGLGIVCAAASMEPVFLSSPSHCLTRYSTALSLGIGHLFSQ